MSLQIADPVGAPEEAVSRRYAAAARAREEALCCPVTYSGQYLAAIPQEILERDYGCGDPSPHVRPGETVLDLGSGGGKLCYILAQVVGSEGKVIGVDCNTEMLELARKYRQSVADRLGFANVDFRYGMIQDLQLDLDLVERELQRQPVDGARRWLELRSLEERLRREQPLIASGSVDCVVSNCVLNLVRTADRQQLFAEIFRVLREGGRAAISDIVADEDVPEHLQRNPELWSGCVSGAYREDLFLEAFRAAGFRGIEIASRDETPWRTVEGIEFRSVTVVARKPPQGSSRDLNQAVIYRGPFREVEDDEGRVFPRGVRIAVSDVTSQLLQQPPYAGQFLPIEPREPVAAEGAPVFDERRQRVRDPRETKGETYQLTIADGGACCGPDQSCC